MVIAYTWMHNGGIKTKLHRWFLFNLMTSEKPSKYSKLIKMWDSKCLYKNLKQLYKSRASSLLRLSQVLFNKHVISLITYLPYVTSMHVKIWGIMQECDSKVDPQSIPKRPNLFSAQYGYTFPSILRSIAAAAAFIQRRILLHLKKKEVMKLPGILATCAGQICWTDKHLNQ